MANDDKTALVTGASSGIGARNEAMLKGKTLIVPGLLNKLTIGGLLRISPRKLATRISRRMMEER